MLERHRIEASIAAAIALLLFVLAAVAPSFFLGGNLIDLVLANLPVLVIAVGSMLVLLTGEIDISSGSVFALCSVTAGALAVRQVPVPVAIAGALVLGGLAGAANGLLVAYAGIPSIVVTLAAMVVVRDGLRWLTQGAWVQGLPSTFQWLGLTQHAYPVAAIGIVAALLGGAAWTLTYLRAGRALYATGSNVEAARLAGIDVAAVKFVAFLAAGALTALGAVLNAVRFNQIPPNSGVGLELRVVAAVVVGGTAITGGRGSLLGTVLGVALLGLIGPALTFTHANPYWEQAIQGAIILAAIAVDAARGLSGRHARVLSTEAPRARA